MSFDHIALLIDLDRDEEPVLSMGARLAELELLPIELLCVIPSGGPKDPTEPTRRQSAQRHLAEVEGWLRSRAEAELEVVPVVLVGDVEDAVLEHLGRTRLELLVVGSGWATLAERAKRSVVVAR